MRVWDAVTGQQRALLTGHDGWVTAVAMAPDGTWLATTDQIGAVRIWEAAAGQVRAVMRLDSWLTDCQWSSRNLSLVAVGQRGVYLFTFRP